MTPEKNYDIAFSNLEAGTMKAGTMSRKIREKVETREEELAVIAVNETISWILAFFMMTPLQMCLNNVFVGHPEEMSWELFRKLLWEKLLFLEWALPLEISFVVVILICGCFYRAWRRGYFLYDTEK